MDEHYVHVFLMASIAYDQLPMPLVNHIICSLLFILYQLSYLFKSPYSSNHPTHKLMLHFNCCDTFSGLPISLWLKYSVRPSIGIFVLLMVIVVPVLILVIVVLLIVHIAPIFILGIIVIIIHPLGPNIITILTLNMFVRCDGLLAHPLSFLSNLPIGLHHFVLPFAIDELANNFTHSPVVFKSG